MRILLDTNVLLRSVEPAHAHHQTSVTAIQILRMHNHELLIAPQVLYEFWSVATRPIRNNGLGMAPAEAHAELKMIQQLFRLLRDERAIYPIWEQLCLRAGSEAKAGARCPTCRGDAAARRWPPAHVQRARLRTLFVRNGLGTRRGGARDGGRLSPIESS